MSQGNGMNGPATPSGRFIDTIDPEDPEYIRNLQRPAEVKEDMKQMEGRSRVSVVLNSQAFREELEVLIQEQIHQGGSTSLFALQQISDLLLPQSRGGASSSFGRSCPVIPINDIRGVETLGYTKQEKVLRCKLASCYRLVDLFGWTHGIFNHISARVSQDQEQFLVNPFGMVYSEVTASTLVKVDVRGEVVDCGSTGLGISKAGFCLHSAIHQARPDIRCIIHLHTPAAVAVSATKKGLLPISQEALLCGKVSYHDYRGILVDQAERDQMARNLGPVNKVMFLRNHGVAACGSTIEEAFHYAFNLMAACEVQVRAMPVGLENLVLIDQETQEKTFRVGSQGGGGGDTSGRKWRCGELEFEALMRILDNAGYRTGHAYKQPLMKQEKKEKINSDVELPPSSSSFTYIFDGDYEHSKYVSPIKLAMERQKQAYKAGWLTSPNSYKKEQLEEIGTTTPKKITKWVQDGETELGSTSIKVENANQFAPQGSNPKEFKQKQKSIRKDYYEEKVTAGPQSRILDGVSAWDEAAKTKDGEQTVVVGAASKGIIQRDHQHNAVVYRSYYAANPFENMTEEDMAAYKQGLEQHEQEQGQGGGEFVFTEESPGPEGRLISSDERHQNIQRSQEDMQEDTEANTAQAMSMDSVVRDDGRVLEQERSVQPPPSPPKALSLLELGLDGLVDTLVQLVMASAQSSSLRQEEKHSVREEDRHSQGSIQDSLSADSSMSLTAPNQCAVKSDSAVSPGEGVKTSVKTSAQKVDVPVIKTELSQVPQIMTVQLEPTKLFQGKPGDGVMRISFSIQSKVTRRKNQGPKSSWPVENVTIMQSEPKVMMVQPAESHPPQILQEQQNVIEPPDEEPVTISVPVSPTYKQKPCKRHFHSSSRHKKLSKLAKPKKKFSRWSRRGLTHPLSPVTEEFMEGDDTLEALLAQQTVHVDSDDSLEELLLMTEEYEENFVPKPQSDEPQASSSSAEDRTAPIATVEDLDENGDVSPASTQGEKPEEGPVFVVPKAAVNHPVSPYRGQGTYAPVKPSSPGPPEEQVCGDQTGEMVGEAFETDKKAADIDDELKFADEMSSTFPEASDGDIAPRKQEEGLGSAGLMHLTPDSMEGVPVEEEMAQKTSGVLSASVYIMTEAFVEEENIEVDNEDQHYSENVKEENEDQHYLVFPSVSQPEPGSNGTEKSNGTTFKTDGVETSPPLVDRGPDTDSAPKPSADPGTHAPLAACEEDLEAPAPAISSSEEEEEKSKTALYRSDSAALENSPIVRSPPFDDFPPEPVYRELHRVRSLEDELDEPSSVQRRLSRGHGAMRRVQSVGPALDSTGSKNRNVAVIDAVLHTVAIDPAQVAQSGQSVATYLREASDQTAASDDQKKRWTLMDSVSKTLETLDVEDLAKEGSMIYGRSLEIVIQSGNMPQKSTPSSSPHETKTSSSENLVEDYKENVAPKSTKLYKDDVVVITKTPIEFSAISPQIKKDIGEEEGPLVTSSPKLGRRKEGSFKKYQSKMGKSEETLLEVAPLTPEKVHPAARRTTSFPTNYGLIKNRSRETLLNDHHSSQTLDRERELRTSSQSVDAVTERNKRRKKSRQARNSDPAYSYTAVGSPLESENLYMKNRGRRKSEEVYSSAAKSTDSIDRSEISREERDHSHRRRRRQPSPEGGREQVRRRRRRGQMEEGVEDSEDETERAKSRDRDRRRREDSTGDREAGVVDEPERAKSRDRDRDRRRREASTGAREAGVVDEPERAKSRDRDRRRRREDSTGDREAGIVDEPERAKSRDRRRRREDSTGDREAGVVDEPERAKSRDRDRDRRREDSTGDREAGVVDEPERAKSRDRDRDRRRRREDSTGDREAGIVDEPERAKSRDRDRRRRREDSTGDREAGVVDEPERAKSRDRDRRRREDSTGDREAGIVDEPERAKSRDRDRDRRREDSTGDRESGVVDEPERAKSRDRDRDRRRREDSTGDRESGVVDEPERAKSRDRDRDRRRREDSTGDREAGVVDEPERAKSRDRDRRRREDSTGDREAGAVDEPERAKSRDRDRDRRRREDSTGDREAGVVDEPERAKSRDRDRRRRRENSTGDREAGVVDEPERAKNRDRDRRREESTEDKETGLEDEPERLQSSGRDRKRRRGQMEEGIDDREDESEKMQSSGRDRRRKRREESTEGREDELKKAQSPGREGRRRKKEGTEDRDAGVVGDPERTHQSSIRDRRRKDKEVDDRENEAERMESSGRDRRRRGQMEDDREAGQVYEPERVESSSRDRRMREESTEDRETGVGNDPERMPSSDRDRRERSGELEEGTERREVDKPERMQTLGRDRRSGDIEEGTEDREVDKPERTQTSDKDRRRRRGNMEKDAEDREVDEPGRTQTSDKDRRRRRGNMEKDTEDREVDEPGRTQTSDKDSRQRRQRDMEEMSDLQTAEAAGRGQEKVEGEEQVYDSTEQSTDIRKEAGAVEVAVPPAPSPDTELQDTEDFPPPPDDLFDYEKQMETDVDDTAQVTSQQEEDSSHLPADPVKDSSHSETLEDEDEENQPPRVRRPETQAKQTERTSTDSGTLKTDRDAADKTELRKSQNPGTDPSQEGSTFMSSFKQPDRNSQTLGEDFPSLAVKSTDKENSVTEKRKAEKDSKMNVLSEPIESEGTVPIAGNLDLLDYSDETALRMDLPQHSPTEDDKPKTSRARQRAERRRRMKSGEDKEGLRLSVSSSEGPKDSTDTRAAGEARGSSSRETLTRQDSLESRELREQQKGRRSSKDSEKSRSLKDRRSSRDSTASRDITNIRASRDSVASRGKSNRTEYIASKENLSRRESQESDVAGVDIMGLDQEPARGRQDRVQRDSASRNMDREDRKSENGEKPRSGGRVRGRRSGHGEGLPHTDRPTRNDRMAEDNTQSSVPWIRVKTASRETLDKEDFAPPLPPKQHISMEHLSELGQDPRRSRSKEILDAPDSPDIPPELPPKKNKKILSCVGGHDMENDASPKKERKSKDRSSSKERKKMPPPPAPPSSDQRYSEEPRRRRRHQDSNHLKVPGDSLHREDSFDASVEKDRRRRERQSSSTYYGDSEDVFDGAEAPHRRDEKRPVQEDGTVSPPQTPRSARKISTSSYSSVSARIARSVSFDDGYTPTMSHPPHHNKSRESLGSEASYHSTSYRPRSYSGASETSLVSNPLNYEPWRTKASAQHSKSPNSRRRRSGSQGEPTYSANAGRRRHSRAPSSGDTNRLYQPRRTRSRSSLPDAPSRSAAPSGHNRSRDTSMLADDSFSDAYSHGYASEAMQPVPAPRRSDPERQQQKSRHREVDEGRPVDSASGGETLEERSSKEGSPTKEAPSPTKDKKKKKKFRMPSFAKNKKKDSKESTL